jgi:hypothetical protein
MNRRDENARHARGDEASILVSDDTVRSIVLFICDLRVTTRLQPGLFHRKQAEFHEPTRPLWN